MEIIGLWPSSGKAENLDFKFWPVHLPREPAQCGSSVHQEITEYVQDNAESVVFSLTYNQYRALA
jgi:hypothetical protein